jgi:flavin reductase (DIM6/NTAB) family NADH-FMN oxidoreductase RutF
LSYLMREKELTAVEHGVALRSLFAAVPAPVAVLCAEVSGKLVAFVASSFVCVSLDPPLVGVCVQRESTSWPRLRGASRIGVSVLSAHQGQLARRLASRSPDKFEGAGVSACAGGDAFVRETVLRLSCSVHGELPAGDHDFALLRIHGAVADNSREPMVFHKSSFRQLSAHPSVDALGWALEWQ